MKKSFCLLLIAAVYFSGAFACLSDAAAYTPALSSAIQNNSITGFVFNVSRKPIADVYVELQSDLGTTLTRERTSGSGFFAFRGLREGRYNVKVLTYNTNYEEQSRPVSLISISAIPGSGGVSQQVDFYLSLKRDPSVGPLAAPGVIFAQEVPDRAKKLYEEGINFLGDKKEKEGFESLKRALEIFPDYFLALDRLGTEYVVRGFYRPAYVLLTKAVEVNPKSFSSTFGLGLAQFRLQEYFKASETLKRATTLYGDSADAHMWLGVALLQDGRINNAEDSLNQANKLSDGKSANVHWHLARLYSNQKRYDEAANELELFLKYNKEEGDTEKIKQTIALLRQKAAGQ